MKKIILLTDYLNRFGSKHGDNPYRSGMDKAKLTNDFAALGYQVEFIKFSDVDLRNRNYNGSIILYTSQEDVGYYYKSFIEDIVYALEISGAIVIPGFKFLKANNNKVFMELLRDLNQNENVKNLTAKCFGTLEEFDKVSKEFSYPVVVKGAEGASGESVELAKSKNDALKKLKKMTSTFNAKNIIRQVIRKIKYSGYLQESRYRKKYIVQEFIPNLVNDWKVYVFYDQYFVFYRPIFKHRGIKASGGGYDNYFFGSKAKFNFSLLDYARSIFSSFNVPCASLDIAFADGKYYLIEFQFLYFGTAGILKKYSDVYYTDKNGWMEIENEGDIEYTYANSIVKFVENMNIDY